MSSSSALEGKGGQKLIHASGQLSRSSSRCTRTRETSYSPIKSIHPFPYKIPTIEQKLTLSF
jgi:hypothetical protein